MKEIRTERLLLRAFGESDRDGLYAFLLQLKDDEFEGYPDITYENVSKYLEERVGSDDYCDPRNVASWKLLEKVGMRREAHLKENIYFFKGENGKPRRKDTYVYAMLDSEKDEKSKNVTSEKENEYDRT